MCETCDITIQQETKSKGFGELLVMERRYDPTRTLTARNRFAREMRRRFNRLQREIREAIVDKDVFALKEEPSLRNPLTQVERRAFAFPRSQDKVTAFMEWLQGRVDSGILEIREGQQLGDAVEDAWTNQYITDSYKRGVQRARYEMQKAGYPVPSINESGGIQAAMNTPFHMDRVGLLYARVYSDLKGVTDAMDLQISRVLSQGMADGDGPRLLARKINATISGAGAGDLGISDTLGRFIPAKRRAEMIARTEIIRSHHQATIQEYKNWRVEGVRVKAEWRTAGDGRVCEECEMLEASEWTLEEIESIIPVHPNCRCIALPLDITDKRVPGEVVEGEILESDIPFLNESIKGEVDADFIIGTVDDLNTHLKKADLMEFGKGGGFSGISYYTRIRGLKFRISDHGTAAKWAHVYGTPDKGVILSRAEGGMVGMSKGKAAKKINQMIREINQLRKTPPVVEYGEISIWQKLKKLPDPGQVIMGEPQRGKPGLRATVLEIGKEKSKIMIEGRTAPTIMDTWRIEKYWGDLIQKTKEVSRS